MLNNKSVSKDKQESESPRRQTKPALRNKWKSLNNQLRFGKTFIQNLKSCIAPRTVPFDYRDVSGSNLEENTEGWEDSSICVRLMAVLNISSNFFKCFFYALFFGYSDFRTQFIDYIWYLCLLLSLINLATSFYIVRDDNGFMCTDLKSIKSCYLRGPIHVDVAVLLLEFCCLLGWWQAALPAYLFKHLQLLQNQKFFQRCCIKTQQQQLVWKLASLILTNLLVANFLAIILNAMTWMSSNSYQSNNWREVKKLPSIWYIEYFWTLYWSISKTTTVGYGDIVPANATEAMIVAFCQLLGGIVFVYNINSIGNVISEFNLQQKELRKKMNTLRQFIYRQGYKLQSQKLKKTFQDKVRKDVIIRNQTDRALEKDLINNLEEKFREKVVLNLRQPLLKGSSLFKMFSDQVKKQLSLKLEHKILFNEEHLSCRNALNLDYFILERGSAAHIFRQGADQKVIALHSATERGSLHFGVRSLLNRAQLFTMRVFEKCQLYCIDLASLTVILRLSQTSRELFCKIKDSYQELQNFQKDCICVNKRHNLENCPRYHYAPFRSLVWCKSYKKKLQQRKKMSRTYSPRHTVFFAENNHQLSLKLADPQSLLFEQQKPKLTSANSEQNIVVQGPTEESSYEFQTYFPQYNYSKALARFNKEASKALLKLVGAQNKKRRQQ